MIRIMKKKKKEKKLDPMGMELQLEPLPMK
jgi:hypothetical protein